MNSKNILLSTAMVFSLSCFPLLATNEQSFLEEYSLEKRIMYGYKKNFSTQYPQIAEAQARQRILRELARGIAHIHFIQIIINQPH